MQNRINQSSRELNDLLSNVIYSHIRALEQRNFGPYAANVENMVSS